MFKYILILTKEGRTRFSKYYVDLQREDKVLTEAEIGRKCLQRRADQVEYFLMISPIQANMPNFVAVADDFTSLSLHFNWVWFLPRQAS